MKRIVDAAGPAHVTAVVRIGLAPLVAIEAAGLWRELGVRFFRDGFHWPLLPAALLPSRRVWAALILVQFVLAALILVGRAARPSLLAAALFQLYIIGCDRNAYHNYRYAFALALVLTALMPCDRALAWRRPERDGPLWAAELAKLQVALIYLASGGSKLLDPDWRGGYMMADGVARFSHAAIAHGVPAPILTLLSTVAVTSIVAKLAIATELTLACLPFVRRWRAPLLWVGLMFHLMIQIVTTVAIFGALMVLLYALFARPELRERVLELPTPRQRHLVRALDWLRRFRIVPGDRLRAVDRDGRAYEGAGALALVARATPLLFPLWPPLWLYARARADQRR